MAIVGTQDVNVTGLYKGINAGFDTSGNVAQGISDNSLIIGAFIALAIVVGLASGFLQKLWAFIATITGIGGRISNRR